MTDKIVVLITFPNKDLALQIGEKLVEKKLVACAQITQPIISIYEWENQIEKSEEVILILKTREDKFESVCDEVLKHHPYKVPQIVSLKVDRGLLSYLQWIDSVLGQKNT